MQSKELNKFKIAIIALALALMVAIGGIFGVLASRNQNVKSSFSIAYNVDQDIACKIKMEYEVGSTRTTLTRDSEGNIITDNQGWYKVNVNDEVKQFDLGEINIDPNNPQVTIYFTYESIAETKIYSNVSRMYTKKDNITIKYYKTETENVWEEYPDENGPDVDPVNIGEKEYYKVVITPEDVNKNADISGVITFHLNRFPFEAPGGV